ncbi:HTH_Tnp_Tc3_2 domain-containing protein [Trichonephila clavipes]|nr:HTH_Tnp_Tc3_2 domain-containing protein [Trichonephila clavipes]
MELNPSKEITKRISESRLRCDTFLLGGTISSSTRPRFVGAEYGIDGFRTVIQNTVRPPITSSREDRHVTHMALMDRAATLPTLSQESRSFARQQVSARTVRRRLLQHELSAGRSWLQLP